MKLDKKTVEYVANLSRIKLDERQSELMQSELGKILDYMEMLKSVDTEGIEPLSHVFERTNVTRADEIWSPFAREIILQSAPESTSEAFVVPKTVE